MKERPILFNAEMVNAILEGRKTQTRRIMKPQPPADFCAGDVAAITNGERWAISRSVCNRLGKGAWPPDPELGLLCPQGKIGDQLWVRENYHTGKCADNLKPSELSEKVWTENGLWYPATNEEPKYPISPKGKCRPSIFMPRWASRIQLEIINVRVERLNDISNEDAMKEGIGTPTDSRYATDSFKALWQSIYGEESWFENPWVWAIEFKQIEKVTKAA